MLLQSCSKSDDTFTPTLPPITQVGANTFGCYLDGQLLVPRNGEGTFNSPSPGATYFVTGNVPTDYNSVLYVNDYKSGTKWLQLSFEDIQNGEGTYEIKDSNCQDFSGGNPNPTINLFFNLNNTLYCSIEDTGTLNITRYDYSNGILSGTFSCSAVNVNDSNDIIEVTEGRFDIVWGTIRDKVFP